MQIEPCRFCGGKAKCNGLRRGNYRRTGDNFQVVCNKCRARGPLVQDDPDEAVRRWNGHGVLWHYRNKATGEMFMQPNRANMDPRFWEEAMMRPEGFA